MLIICGKISNGMSKIPVQKSCVILGKTIQYWVYNESAKKTIVAIHGLRGTHHGLQFIAQKLPDYAIIVPDLPGHGESEPLDVPHTVDNYASFLRSFIHNTGIATPAIILGHSFGCSIVGRLARHNPQMVEKLVLINPVVEGGNPVGMFLAKSYYKAGNVLPENLGTALLRSKMITRAMTFFTVTAKRKRLKKRVYEQHLAHFSSFANRKTVSETFYATTTDLLADTAENLVMPILMIVGKLDSLAPYAQQQILHSRFKNAELKVIPYAGHLIHYETPELAARHIENFLNNKT